MWCGGGGGGGVVVGVGIVIHGARCERGHATAGSMVPRFSAPQRHSTDPMIINDPDAFQPLSACDVLSFCARTYFWSMLTSASLFCGDAWGSCCSRAAPAVANPARGEKKKNTADNPVRKMVVGGSGRLAFSVSNLPNGTHLELEAGSFAIPCVHLCTHASAALLFSPKYILILRCTMLGMRIAVAVALAASAAGAGANLAGLLSAGQFYHEGTSYKTDRWVVRAQGARVQGCCRSLFFLPSL